MRTPLSFLGLVGLVTIGACNGGESCPDGSAPVGNECPCEAGGTDYPSDFEDGECPESCPIDYTPNSDGECERECDDGSIVVSPDSCAGDGGDCGDTIETACAITFSEGLGTIEETIGEPGDRDFFAIDTVAGTYYGVIANTFNPDGGTPDTVCRVYDAEGNEIAENDDMPRRQFNTDCAMLFRATEATTYYVEILDWSDWDAGTPADGNDSYVYQFAAIEMPIVEQNEDDAALQTDNDILADAIIALEDGEPDWWGDPWENSYLYQYGAIDAPNDVDLFGIGWESTDEDPFEPAVCQFSMYPGIPTALTPGFRLLDGEGNQLANTSDPYIYPDYDFLYDGGITFPLGVEGNYFVEVTDTAGSGGADHWYAFEAAICYPAVFDDGVNPPVEQFTFDQESSSTLYTASTDVSVREYSSGNYGGSFVGFMDDGATDFDSWRILDRVAIGQTMTLYIETTKAGSSLDDMSVVLYDADGAELDTASGADLTITHVTTTSGPYFVSIESSNVATDSYYLGSLLLED